MDLNNTERMKELDPQGMIDWINELPEQLAEAWELGQNLELKDIEKIDRVIIAGMGGSAIGADLISSYVFDHCEVPIFVHRDYDLPAFAKGDNTLVICSSHSGNTEETLTAFEAAQANGCKLITISTGGKISEAAKQTDASVWTFDNDYQPRAAVGYSFGLLLAAFSRLGLIPDPSQELTNAVEAMKAQQRNFLPDVPDTQNQAKRIAGQLVGRWVTIYGAGFLAPVARRWKGQINELAKAIASFEVLPEADHNAFAGLEQPENNFGAAMTLFLRSTFNHPRNQLRDEFTRMGMMVQGINTDFIVGQGETRLAQMWTLFHFGDYVAYYLAMAYGIDPTPVDGLIDLKEKLSNA